MRLQLQFGCSVSVHVQGVAMPYLLCAEAVQDVHMGISLLCHVLLG